MEISSARPNKRRCRGSSKRCWATKACRSILAKLKDAGFGAQVAVLARQEQGQPADHGGPDPQALGDEHVQQIAKSLGIPMDKVLDALAKYLPQAVNAAGPAAPRSLPEGACAARRTIDFRAQARWRRRPSARVRREDNNRPPGRSGKQKSRRLAYLKDRWFPSTVHGQRRCPECWWWGSFPSCRSARLSNSTLVWLNRASENCASFMSSEPSFMV